MWPLYFQVFTAFHWLLHDDWSFGDLRAFPKAVVSTGIRRQAVCHIAVCDGSDCAETKRAGGEARPLAWSGDHCRLNLPLTENPAKLSPAVLWASARKTASAAWRVCSCPVAQPSPAFPGFFRGSSLLNGYRKFSKEFRLCIGSSDTYIVSWLLPFKYTG